MLLLFSPVLFVPSMYVLKVAQSGYPSTWQWKSKCCKFVESSRLSFWTHRYFIKGYLPFIIILKHVSSSGLSIVLIAIAPILGRAFSPFYFSKVEKHWLQGSVSGQGSDNSLFILCTLTFLHY